MWPYYLNLYKIQSENIFEEISPKLTPEEKKLIKKAYKHLGTLGKVMVPKNTEFDGVVNVLNPPAFQRHWHYIGKINTQLRCYADRHGMLLTDRQTAQDAAWE